VKQIKRRGKFIAFIFFPLLISVLTRWKLEKKEQVDFAN
jgi:hypothetical protein